MNNNDSSFVGYDPIDHKYNGCKKVVDKEFDAIKTRRPDADKDNLKGIALSGGGIRSASFCLGVMQALAKHDKLKKFDYLSTVSGGGYIGGALSWLWLGKWKGAQSARKFGTDKDNFPYGTGGRYSNTDQEMDTDQAKLMRHLRQNGKYLTPGNGITALSLLSILLRGMLMGFVTMLVLASFFFHTLYLVHDKYLITYKDVTLLNIGLVLLAAYLLGLLFYGFTTIFIRGSHHAYVLRRLWEKYIKFALIAAGFFLLLALIHKLTALLSTNIETTGLSALIGALIAWFSQKSGKSSFLKYIPNTLLVYFGVALMFIGLFVVSEYLALSVHQQADALTSVELIWGYHALVVFGVLLSAYLIPINKVSIHRYYRDRLMETFNPDVDKVLQNKKRDHAYIVNKTGLHECMPDKENTMPYHIINANIILVDSNIPKFRGRGGDNFILTPLYSGSNATGWRDSSEFAGGSMTLPSAVAISGAAANSNSGVAGAGLTMNPLISKLMSIFNIRLGYWTINPSLKKNNFLKKDQKTTPNFLNPGIKGIFNLEKLSEQAEYIQLSDGGHFENLAVYELLRRHCGLIVCCDAEQDSDFVFGALANLIEKARVDFGVKIDISEKDLAKLKYQKNSDGELQFAEQGYLCVDIIYPEKIDTGESKTGKFIYIKTTLAEGLPADVMGYKYTHNDFPDETTADQFFDEKQMEAYRMLGMNIAETIVEKNVL